MSADVIVPQLGESIVEATVGRWMKNEGDSVTEGESLVELETEKVNMEVPSPGSGVLQTITKHEGDTVAVGEVIAVLAEGGQASATQPVATAGSASAEWTAAVAPVAAVAGARATPLAQRMAEKQGIDLGQVRGTGADGRITQDDVAAYMKRRENGASAAAPIATVPTVAPMQPQPAARPAPVLQPAPAIQFPPEMMPATAAGRREERVRMSRRRQTIARRLVEAQRTAAMLTTFNEVDMSAVMELRQRRREAFKERHGVGLGFMSFFTRAVIGALKAYPRLNAEIQGDEMVLKHYYDIGIAVSTEEGLVVPVLRDADRMSFAEIEQGIAGLARKARERTLTLDELQGGTFTITNGGTFGSLLSTPILNAPQVGILGMHKIEERPIALKGQVVIHPMMYLAVSYDHRIVDGAEAVGFLVRVKELLEDPETLLLEG
ncbi:MAG: dihydrolipoamide succinyltransferase component (E2) of 2-oxoglutarate dehydrogenase complex [Ktedonobacterales bacterium]|jgi:2-oxoglutarate dehydrogenase E2 component (dihydrolipoamide succinyltransferase)|nr:MAG: dihydrolipoamide succinyltransferase component (E2) of 2-oxoglutarate dehydrogenase complex [Ktedonobacterales bacterium]